MKFKLLFFFTVVFSQLQLFAGDGIHVISSTLRSAIVYRNGAELVHAAKANLHQGNNDLVIGDISNEIDVSSIQIGCSGEITILSVEFSKEFLKPETKSATARKIEDSISVINKDLSKIGILIKSDNDLLDLLKANKEIRGTASGLSVAELMKMMDYYKQKSLELQNEISEYRERESRFSSQVAALQNQLKEEESKNTKTSGRIFLQLLSPADGTYDFTISYLTPTAFWNPSYDLRVNNINEPLKLLYKAKLVQTSGIDWKQVKLTLSTAVPSQHENAPILKTWFLTYVDPVKQANTYFKSNTIQSMANNATALNEVVVTGYGVSRKKDISSSEEQEDPLYIVDGKQMSAEEFGKLDQRVIKKMEALKGEKAVSLYGQRAAQGVFIVTLKDELGDYVSVKDNQLNVTFDIDLPYDISSNGKEQNVVLKTYDVPVLYKYYSVPKLDNASYLLGEIPEWQQLNLLPGEANIIFEGTYVGKSYIDPNSTEDTLNLTLGNDKRVVVKKEKLKDYSSIKFLGANKKQVFTYEITVKNNKKEKVRMQLKDQYPITSNKDIEVELLESSDAFVNDETGVLTWKMELSPGETKKFRISYSVKYPKDKFVNVN
jgi:hypothetical protein